MWSGSTSSTSGEVDFLNLCNDNVHDIEVSMRGKNLLNSKQCQDLRIKLSKTTSNIQELVLRCEAPADLIRPALQKLYRHLEKAKVLVSQCGDEDWCRAAVFQGQNENAFREIVLDVGFCYNAIYEEAKSGKEDSNIVLPEDLRTSFVFKPAKDDDVLQDHEDLRKRLEGLVNHTPRRIRRNKEALRQRLAKYLLDKFAATQSQTFTLETNSEIFWTKDSKVSGVWGSSDFLGAGAGASGVCKTKWMSIPCAKKVFHAFGSEVFFLKEAGILARLKHPCIVTFFCCGNGEKRGDRFIAMEFMEKSLAKLIQDQKYVYFPIPVVVDLMVQMARGMWYLHEQGVAHRDLKPDNVVVNTLTYSNLDKHFCAKVVDFGMSKTKVEATKSNIMSAYGIGTTRYKAPEVYSKAHLDGQKDGKATWLKADVFSFAMTCAHVLSLKMPFKETMPSELYYKLRSGERPRLPEYCPQELVELLKDCWNLNPRLRPPFIDICTRLETFQHKLLRGFLSNDKDSQGVNYDGGFEFIKNMITNQSMMGERLVDDNDDEVEGLDLVEVEEFNDFERNDFVSVILCSCGKSLKLLPHAPYPGKEFECNICLKHFNGEVYHCENCQFDAHRDCAEIKDKVDVFFHHDTLHLLLQNYYDNNPEVTCDFCEESLQGSKWVYSCMQCDFNVHALCTKYSRKIYSIEHHGDPLALVQSSAGKNATCVCCNGDVKGYWYTCTQKRCSFGGMHPICKILPRNPLCIFNLSHRLQLEKFERSSGFYCGRCGTEGFSWLYCCRPCNVDIHLDCVHDTEEENCDLNRAYDQFMLEYEKKANQNVIEMMEELLNMLLVSTGLETRAWSSSSPPPVITRRQPRTGQTPPSSKAQSSNLLGVVSRQSTIGSEAKKMAVKRARQRIKAGWMVELGVKLKILGEILEDVQGSKVDAEVLAGMHVKLRKLRDFVEESNASKIRQVPRAGLFYSYNFLPGRTNMVLHANLCDFKGGKLHLGLLCEESDHEHILRGWSMSTFWDVDEHDREQLEKLQPVVDSGLQLVRMALSRATHITTLDSVTLPILGEDPWDLRAIDLDEHGIQTKLASQGDEENVEIQEVAEDAGAEALKTFIEDNRRISFDDFGLLRVRYTKTEERDCPRYKQGTVAWLCREHRNCGLEAGVLESYPLRIYHNLEYDQERGFL